MKDRIRADLLDLMAIAGLSGHEDRVRRALRDRPHGLREARRAVDARPVTPASVRQMVAKMHFA